MLGVWTIKQHEKTGIMMQSKLVFIGLVIIVVVRNLGS